MDGLYSIGETAKLNDVSIKSLRHYDEIGLLKPMYIDPETGYRYYAYSQFSFIDKIKRYKNVGLSLKDLKEVFQNRNLGQLEELLREQQQSLEEEARRLEDKRQDIQWLVDFLEYSRKMAVDNHLYWKDLPEMTVLRVPCDGDDAMYTMDMELRRVASSAPFNSCQLLNPYGYLLDFDRLLENRMYPTASTVCIRGEGLEPSPYLFSVPAGRYLCCKARILSGEWDVSPLAAFCRRWKLRPSFVLANEYLSSLYDPANSPYEICLPVPGDHPARQTALEEGEPSHEQ